MDEPLSLLYNEQTIFYLLCFTIAAAAGLFRTLMDRSYQSLSHLVGVCGTSGVLGFIVVGLMSGGSDSVLSFIPRYLSIAAGIGVLGIEAKELILTPLGKAIGQRVEGFLGVRKNESIRQKSSSKKEP